MKHKLKKDEKLEHLSARYRVPVCMIVRANGYLTDLEEIEIPKVCYCNKCPAARHWTRFEMHCVGGEESADIIAKRCGISVNELVALNGMCSADEICPGAVICVPLG